MIWQLHSWIKTGTYESVIDFFWAQLSGKGQMLSNWRDVSIYQDFMTPTVMTLQITIIPSTGLIFNDIVISIIIPLEICGGSFGALPCSLWVIIISPFLLLELNALWWVFFQVLEIWREGLVRVRLVSGAVARRSVSPFGMRRDLVNFWGDGYP